MGKNTVASVGNRVHVAGVVHFLQPEENEGNESIFLGPAVSPAKAFNNRFV